MAEREHIIKIVKTIKVIMRDLKKAYPTDEILLGTINDIGTLINVSEYKVAIVIGKYLDKYYDQISTLYTTRDFSFFVEVAYDEVNASASKKKSTIEYIIPMLHGYLESMDQSVLDTYISYVTGMLDSYYAIQELEN